MERRRALCGSGERHGPHRYWVHSPAYIGIGPEAADCPGWAAREADASELADRLDRVGIEHSWPRALPPGIRLECHPSVPGALRDLFVPSYEEFLQGVRTGEEMPKPSIPVVVTAMEPGQWRITADSGLIAEGTVHDGR